jgi:hypothetical protein
MSSSTGYNRYVIKQYSQLEYLHGGVGYVDAERILIKEGFERIEFPRHDSFTPVAKLDRLRYLVRQSYSIKKDSIVIFLFPVYSKAARVLIRRLVKKGVRCICYLADINGIKDGDEKGLAEEISFLQLFQYFIVHNAGMRAWLDSIIPGNVAEEIKFFDFLTQPVTTLRPLSNDIVFAGNLAKSPFLEKLHLLEDTPLRFNVYGPGGPPALTEQKNVYWHGSFPPYQLPSKLQGSFGLLWDDACIDKPCGHYGAYMPYISHHKLSLYILSRLPIIVPAIAGSASLVEKYGIGFAINSLYEIPQKIKSLTEVEYFQMQENMKSLANDISQGECLKGAISRLLQKIH